MLEVVNERKSAFGKKIEEIRMFNKNSQFSNFAFQKQNNVKNDANFMSNKLGNEGLGIIPINKVNNNPSKENTISKFSISNNDKFTGNNNYSDNNLLGKKQNFNNKSIADLFSKSLNNSNQSTELIPRKIEFKLSHVLKGGDIEIHEKIEKCEFINKEKEELSNNNNNNDFKLSIDKPKGFNNVGNTCFLNSVLQSLCSTQILVNYLFKNDHINSCQLSKQSVCILCQFHKLLIAVNTCKNSSYTPMSIVQNIKVISKSLRIGRQEDSHEFLTKMLELLESSNLKDLKMKDTNFVKNLNDTHKGIIYDIFGGEVNSTVTCGQCKHKSVKKEDFYSISLDLSHETVEECFVNYCKPDYLIGENKYLCDNCKSRTNSNKRFTFKKLPKILIIQLKRFDNFLRKVKNFVRYPKELDISKICDKIGLDKGQNDIFELYSVLVHEGFTLNSGHYFSYVKHNNKNWFEANDSFVSKVDDRTVMSQKPYILFYCRKNYGKCSIAKPVNLLNQHIPNQPNINIVNNGNSNIHSVNNLKNKSNDDNNHENNITKDEKSLSLGEDNSYTKNERPKVEKFIDLRKVHKQNLNQKTSDFEKDKHSNNKSLINLKDTSSFNPNEKYDNKNNMIKNDNLLENQTNNVLHDFFDDMIIAHPYNKETKTNKRIKIESPKNISLELDDIFEFAPIEITNDVKNIFKKHENEKNIISLKDKKEPKETKEKNRIETNKNDDDYLSKTSSSINNCKQMNKVNDNENKCNLFNGKKSNTWSDSEDEKNDESKKSKINIDTQKRFIESNEVFNKSKPNVKSAYDIKYDEGKSKKVKLKLNKNKDRNQFQRFQKKFSLKENN